MKYWVTVTREVTQSATFCVEVDNLDILDSRTEILIDFPKDEDFESDHKDCHDYWVDYELCKPRDIATVKLRLYGDCSDN